MDTIKSEKIAKDFNIYMVGEIVQIYFKMNRFYIFPWHNFDIM